MTTYNKDRIGLQEVKDLPTYSVTVPDLDNIFMLAAEAMKIVQKDYPDVWGFYHWTKENEQGLYLVWKYESDSPKTKNLFYIQFRKPLPKPKTRQEIAKETLAEIIKEFDVQDSEMSIFTINQMKYALAHASDESISEFLFFYYDSDKWLEDYPDPDPEALRNLKIGEFKYCQNFEVIKVETLEETKYWVLNGKHTNELECGRTLVFTNFDPDTSNGVDYEEFLFSYITYTGAEK